MKRSLKYLSFVILPLLVASAYAPRASAADLGNIWPLGDSVTYGALHRGGYRTTLVKELIARGDTFKMVGTLTSNSTKYLRDVGQAHHDGHSGFTIANSEDVSGKFRRGLYQSLDAWHKAIKKPNIILLMIGINDLNIGYKVESAPERLDRLVDRLFSYYPHVRLLIATLPDADPKNKHRHGATNDLKAAVSHYNAGISSIVGKYKEKGRDIYLVNMHAAFTLADLRDGLHPNPSGYVKMGKIWANAIAVTQPKSGSNSN